MTETTAPTETAPPDAALAPPDAATADGSPAADEQPPFPLRWVVFAAVLIADIMDLVDSTIMNVGGPSIQADIGGGESLLQWLGAAYTLTFAVFLITGARLGDLYGRRKVFLIGAAGFTLASAACALAWSPESLIALRVVQGGFGALMIPQGFGMLTEILGENDMQKGFAVFGPVMGLSAILGPILGATLLDADVFGTGWRAIFLINLPLGLFALVAGARAMPRTVVAADGGLDLPGMALVGAAAFALIYPLIEGREQDWPWWVFAILAVGVLLALAFVARLRRTPVERALVRISLVRNKSFSSGMAVANGFFAAFGGLTLVLGLYWQVGEHRTPTESAVALIPLTAGMVVGMVGSFALVEKFGRKLIQIGVGIASIGLVVLAASMAGSEAPSAWSAAPGTVIIGIGAGFVFGQLFDVILASIEDEAEVGSASGLLNALQQFSFSLGVAVFGTIFFDVIDVPKLPSDALAITALACLVPLAISFVLAFRLPPKPRPGGAH